MDNGTKNTNSPDIPSNHDQSEQGESDSSVEVSRRRTRKRKTTTNYVESDTASTSDVDYAQPKKCILYDPIPN